MNRVTNAELRSLANTVAAALHRQSRRLVLAESCTCGLVAALLGEIPGVSTAFCGSAVVYQEATKSAWLGVPESLIAERGVVSAEVAAAMAAGALRATPHADVAASITGHLGPNAPPRLDGVVHIGLQFRDLEPTAPTTWKHRLAADGRSPRTIRLRRRNAAAAALLRRVAAALSQRERRPR